MLGELVIPALLGGDKGVLMGVAISIQYLDTQYYSMGSAMAVLVLIAVAIIVGLLARLTRVSRGLNVSAPAGSPTAAAASFSLASGTSGRPFLFAPIVTSILYSFNAGSRQADVHLHRLDPRLVRRRLEQCIIAALRRDQFVASFWSALISVIVGTSLGFALVRLPAHHSSGAS